MQKILMVQVCLKVSKGMVEYSRVVFWAVKLDRPLRLGLIIIILGPKEGKGVRESSVE